jgi:type III secretory pathway component EscR
MVKFILSLFIMMPVILAAMRVWREPPLGQSGTSSAGAAVPAMRRHLAENTMGGLAKGGARK